MSYSQKHGVQNMRIEWQNPKRFLPLLLFFGIILVVAGTGIESITTNSTLTQDGWIVVAIAVFLWVLKES
jgi:hypothetical protein